MGILMWDRPKKKMTKEEWASYGFEDGPTGGYQSNMSDSDKTRWKAKITGQKLGFPQVEIRKEAGSQMTIIVNLGDGYNYKSYRAEIENLSLYPASQQWYFVQRPHGTFGKQLHIALNGPAVMTLQDHEDMTQAISEARDHLNKMVQHKGERSLCVLIDTHMDKEAIEAMGAKFVVNLDLFGFTYITAPDNIKNNLKAVSADTLSDIVKHVLNDPDYINAAAARYANLTYLEHESKLNPLRKELILKYLTNGL
jgi:ribosome-associated translation inhibitor RaiA